MASTAATLDLASAVEYLQSQGERFGDVRGVEAYASANMLTQARLETLRYHGRTIGPLSQQMVTIRNAAASVRLVIGQRIGVCSTSYLTKPELQQIVEQAHRSAAAQPDDPDFVDLATPLSRTPVRLPHDPAIVAGEVAEPLAAAAEAAIAAVDRPYLDLAGSMIAVSERMAIRSTNGIAVEDAIDTFTVAQLTAEWVEGADVVSSGVGWSSGRHLGALDGAAAANDALELARIRPVQETVPEGDYTVLLGPYAVADIIDNLFAHATTLSTCYYGLSWLPTVSREHNGRQVLEPAEGAQVVSEALTIVDDPTLPQGMASKSYDDEGVVTAVTPLVTEGRLVGTLSNSYFANLYGRPTSGNGFRFGLRPGRLATVDPAPSATNTVVRPGDRTFDELVEQCDGPAIYLPRTWYTYPMRLGGTTFSSSNRATSFLIEGGELIPVAPNAFKLVGDIGTVLGEVMGISKETKMATTWAAASASIAPFILTRGMRVERPGEVAEAEEGESYGEAAVDESAF